jgi:hypothetical protein
MEKSRKTLGRIVIEFLIVKGWSNWYIAKVLFRFLARASARRRT